MVWWPAAIAGATLLVPCHVVKSPQLIWRSGTRSFHLRVPDLQKSCSDLNLRQGTRIIVPIMASRVIYPIMMSVMMLLWQLLLRQTNILICTDLVLTSTVRDITRQCIISHTYQSSSPTWVPSQFQVLLIGDENVALIFNQWCREVVDDVCSFTGAQLL